MIASKNTKIRYIATTPHSAERDLQQIASLQMSLENEGALYTRWGLFKQ
jgi:hypothetical protein